MSRHPEVKWAQRLDKVFITVLLPDAKDAKVTVEPEGVFTFSASAGAGNHVYELKLDLYDKVNVEKFGNMGGIGDDAMGDFDDSDDDEVVSKPAEDTNAGGAEPEEHDVGKNGAAPDEKADAAPSK